MDQFLQILDGFAALTDPRIFFYMILGLVLGEVFAAIPGLTATLAIALILPITYGMDPATALVMCGSIYMGGMHGGSITAVALNIPGSPANVMTAIDGHVMMQRGLGAKALRVAALGSAIGGVAGALILMGLTPIVADLALLIKTPGKFSLVLFSIIIVILSHKDVLNKAVIATLIGMMLATIGIDVMSPVARATYDQSWLLDGIDLMALIIGCFAVTEMLIQSQKGEAVYSSRGIETAGARKDYWPKWSDLREMGTVNLFKSSIIGYIMGVLPGAGGNAAAFLGYVEAKRASKTPEQFGNGSVEGIVASETANNANVGGSFVPTLTFGIPGDSVAAVILGVMIINGLQPGPQLLSTQFHLVAPMMAALVVSAMLLPVVLYIGGPWYLRVVSIPKGILFASIAAFSLIGCYASTYSVSQMWIALVIGVGAFFLQRHNYPSVCLLIGYILGPDLEVYLRRSLSLTDGDPSIFVTSGDSLFFLVLTLIFIYFMVIRPAKIMQMD